MPAIAMTWFRKSYLKKAATPLLPTRAGTIGRQQLRRFLELLVHCKHSLLLETAFQIVYDPEQGSGQEVGLLRSLS